MRKANELLERGIAAPPGRLAQPLLPRLQPLLLPGRARSRRRTRSRAPWTLPGAPLYLRPPRRAAEERARAGSRSPRRSSTSCCVQTDDPQAQAQYEKALDEIETERVARVLDAARERYRARHGRDIAAVADLARARRRCCARSPRSPTAATGSSTRASGEIVSTYVGHRYEPKHRPGEPEARSERLPPTGRARGGRRGEEAERDESRAKTVVGVKDVVKDFRAGLRPAHASACSTASASRCAAARSSASSARTAPARRRR